MKIQSIKENGYLKGIIRKQNKCRSAKKNPGDVFVCVCVCVPFLQKVAYGCRFQKVKMRY